jgi:hypothetical protein
MAFSLTPFRKNRAAKLPAGGSQAFEFLEDRRMLAAASFVSYQVRENDMLVNVRYSDASGVNVATLGDNDITVTGGNSFGRFGHFLSFTQDTQGSNNSVVATYSVAPRSAVWTFFETGTFVVNMQGSAVSANDGSVVPGSGLASFWLYWSTPRVELLQAFATSTQYIVDVKYSDNTGIDPTSIGFGEIGLVPADQPNDVQFFHSQTYFQNQDGSWNVEYRLIARGGSWDWTDTGTYTINLQGNAVHDTETPANFIPAQSLGQVFLWFTNPKAEILTSSVTGTDWLVTVRWTDDQAISAGSIDDGDIQENNGVSNTLAQRVSAVSESANSITVTYSLRPTHFAFGAAENGTHVVSVRDGQVQDTTGTPIHGVSLASYWLWFTNPSISKPTNVNEAQPDHWDITVRYTDDVAMNINTISNGDLRMEGPAGYFQQATMLERHTEVVNGNTTVLATYRFTAPSNGRFNSGTYNIFVNPNQVADTAGNTIPTFLWGSFWLFF